MVPKYLKFRSVGSTVTIDDAVATVRAARDREVPSAVWKPRASRSPVPGEPAASVFPPGEAVVLPVRAAAAMLVSFLPLRPWRARLDCVWQMEDDDGVNFSALHALDARTRRRHSRGASA
jgi:hypothetical protein